jgi:hypothetical protein
MKVGTGDRAADPIGLPEGLMQQVVEGVVDIAIMYTPKNLPGLRVEKLLEEEARAGDDGFSQTQVDRRRLCLCGLGSRVCGESSHDLSRA